MSCHQKLGMPEMKAEMRAIAALLLAAPLRCAAQVATEGFAPFRLEPTTFSYAEVRTPDVELLVAEDAAEWREKHGGANTSSASVPQTLEGARFADVIERNVSLDRFSRHAVAGGGRVHTVRLVSPGALGLQVNFGEFVLPVGARMFVYSNDTTRGAFTHENNKPNRHFAVVPVPGEAVTVEVFVPAGATTEPAVTIKSVAHHYRETFFRARLPPDERRQLQTRCQTSPPFTGYMCSLACQPNVRCPEGAGWEDQTQADAMMIHSEGSRGCSAQMLNNAAADGRQLLTTAWHCENTARGATEDWIFVFDYKTPGCVDPEIEPSLANSVQGTLPLYRDLLISACPDWPGSGAPNDPNAAWFQCGGTDIMVVELLEQIPDSYNVYLNGFNAENGVPHAFAEPVGISHPACDVTKIALPRAPSGRTDWRQPGPIGTHWSVVWEMGGNQGTSHPQHTFDTYIPTMQHTPLAHTHTAARRSCSGPDCLTGSLNTVP
jgi:lysyl endopeptidase